MKVRLTRILFPVILALNFVAPLAAGPLEDGNDAYKRHDYATAMRILRPLANQGDGMAEIIVGLMYKNNFGVPLDYVSAYMWFGLAAAHGDSLGKFLLNQITPKMTQEELAEAQKLVREWKPTTRPDNNVANSEMWSCDVGVAHKTFKQEWIIANGRMTAPRGKGYYRIVRHDDMVIVAFRSWRDEKTINGPFTDYIIIERETGNYIDMNNITMNVMGKAYDDIAEPTINTGHCKLSEATTPSR